jgi:hypothetical protein
VQYKTVDGWGVITHFKLQVDTVLPKNLAVVQSPTTGVQSDTSAFVFTAEDEHSGIARYEVSIDGAQPLSFVGGNTYTFVTPKGLIAGAHTMIVRAFDAAGNEVSTTAQFVAAVHPSEVVQDKAQSSIGQSAFFKTGTTVITILSITIPFVALVLLLSVLLYSAWKMYGGLRTHIRKEVLEAKMVVHKAFTLLRDDLLVDIKTLEKASKSRKLTKEEAKILKRLRQNIDEAEKVIEKEIDDIEHAT